MLDYRAHTFLEVCRQGSFTKAAEALRITQPAVSQHIRQLETHYRAKLFSQRGRRLQLTDAGETLRRALLALSNNEREIEREVAASAEAPAPLRFGVTLTVGDYVMPTCLADHRRANPGAKVTMTVANTQELLDLIDRGELSFALVEGYFDRGQYESLAFSREPYVAVCAPDAPLPRQPDSVVDLLGEELLLREPGSGTREVLERNLAARNLSAGSFASVCELGSIGAIKRLAAAGTGVAFLYRIAVEDELSSGALRDVTPRDFRLEHDLSFIWQRGSMQAERYRACFERWQRAWASRRA